MVVGFGVDQNIKKKKFSCDERYLLQCFQRHISVYDFVFKDVNFCILIG
jgi:hypothetical protein